MDKPYNIPLEIRKTLHARFERKELLKEAAAKVPSLYERADIDEMKTRKGIWMIYTESNYSLPSLSPKSHDDNYGRFCAVYFREKRPLTIIRGNTADKNVIFASLKTVTRKIIEQIPFFSFPKKSLTEENGLTYGIRIGLILAIFLGIFVLFDYMLIPNYPEAFLKGINISFGNSVNNYSESSKIFEYKSITGQIIEHFFPPKYRHLSLSMYTLAGVFILPILFFGFIHEIGGKISDKLRVIKLPEEAFEFQYGFPAAEKILSEYKKIRHEKIKIDFYNKLTAMGLIMNEDEFERIYNDIIVNGNNLMD